MQNYTSAEPVHPGLFRWSSLVVCPLCLGPNKTNENLDFNFLKIMIPFSWSHFHSYQLIFLTNKALQMILRPRIYSMNKVFGSSLIAFIIYHWDGNTLQMFTVCSSQNNWRLVFSFISGTITAHHALWAQHAAWCWSSVRQLGRVWRV